MAPPRSGMLPEHTDYRDDGCEVAPACLECPLVRCRYDERGGRKAMEARERHHEIRTAYLDGNTDVDSLASEFHVSRRTVFRAVEKLRGGAR